MMLPFIFLSILCSIFTSSHQKRSLDSPRAAAQLGVQGFNNQQGFSDNRVLGEPSITCNANNILFAFKTSAPFSGRVFVKGKAWKQGCSTIYSPDRWQPGSTIVFDLPLQTCGMEQIARNRGLDMTLTAVVSFHGMVLTEQDRAFKLNCFYFTSQVSQGISIQPLGSTELIGKRRPVQCSYSIRKDGPTGARMKFAKIGDTAYHVWECSTDKDRFGLLVSDCYVRDPIHNFNKLQILDSRGCQVDPVLLGPVKYLDAESVPMAVAETQVYKYADVSEIKFECNIRMCARDGDQCERMLPPRCQNPLKKVSTKRIIDTDVTFPPPLPKPTAPYLTEPKTVPYFRPDPVTQQTPPNPGYGYRTTTHRTTPRTTTRIPYTTRPYTTQIPHINPTYPTTTNTRPTTTTIPYTKPPLVYATSPYPTVYRTTRPAYVLPRPEPTYPEGEESNNHNWGDPTIPRRFSLTKSIEVGDPITQDVNGLPFPTPGPMEQFFSPPTIPRGQLKNSIGRNEGSQNRDSGFKKVSSKPLPGAPPSHVPPHANRERLPVRRPTNGFDAQRTFNPRSRAGTSGNVVTQQRQTHPAVPLPTVPRDERDYDQLIFGVSSHTHPTRENLKWGKEEDSTPPNVWNRNMHLPRNLPPLFEKDDSRNWREQSFLNSFKRDAPFEEEPEEIIGVATEQLFVFDTESAVSEASKLFSGDTEQQRSTPGNITAESTEKRPCVARELFVGVTVIGVLALASCTVQALIGCFRVFQKHCKPKKEDFGVVYRQTQPISYLPDFSRPSLSGSRDCLSCQSRPGSRPLSRAPSLSSSISLTDLTLIPRYADLIQK